LGAASGAAPTPGSMPRENAGVSLEG